MHHWCGRITLSGKEYQNTGLVTVTKAKMVVTQPKQRFLSFSHKVQAWAARANMVVHSVQDLGSFRLIALPSWKCISTLWSGKPVPAPATTSVLPPPAGPGQGKEGAGFCFLVALNGSCASCLFSPLIFQNLVKGPYLVARESGKQSLQLGSHMSRQHSVTTEDTKDKYGGDNLQSLPQETFLLPSVYTL